MSTVMMDVPFAMVPEWLIKSDVSSHAVRLYAALCRYANLPNGAMPGRRRLADDWLHVSLDTLDRAMKELVDVGALKKISKDGQPNRYILCSRQNSRTRAVIQSEADSRTDAAGNSRTGAARKKDSERKNSPMGSAGGASDAAVVPIESAPSRAARDALWDALSARFGEPATRTERSNRGKCLRELLEADFTPDELHGAARTWERKYPGATFTANALVVHLGELRGPKRAPRVPPCPECEIGGGLHTEGCSRAESAAQPA